jgi:hypothetical protein
MRGDVRFAEDIPQLAAEAFDLAGPIGLKRRSNLRAKYGVEQPAAFAELRQRGP